MKSIVYILIVGASIALFLSVVTKFSSALLIAGIGPTGFLNSAIVLLLFGANFALLELLNKK